MKVIKLIIIGLAFLLCSCASYTCKTYYIPDKSRHKTFTVSICPETVVEQEFQKYIEKGYINITNQPGRVMGFYVPREHKIYSVPDWEILLHEFWHALGNLEEPYWEVEKK